MRRQGRGFTLIELLVVIAIIGILAAMLFPVFARARESARKTQCLANVKNIALAVNMYLTDYDRFWPYDHTQDARDGVSWASNDNCGRCTAWNEAGGPGGYWCDTTWHNPYLQEPVVLDDYIKNRDVWNCPSARVQSGAGFIIPMGRDGLWYNNFRDHWDLAGVAWGGDTGPCAGDVYPPGWGGDITDSFLQGTTYGGASDTVAGLSGNSKNKAFTMSIGVPQVYWRSGEDPLRGKNPASFDDLSHTVIAMDYGIGICSSTNFQAAFPDLCGPHGPADSPDNVQYGCPYSPADDHEFTDAEFFEFGAGGPIQKTYTRHLGGSNLGYADGHAKWMASMEIVAKAREGELEGFARIY